MSLSNSSFILKNDGSVWSCGKNDYGQLGLGDNTNKNTFTKIAIDSVKSITCGNNHTFVLKNDGTVWSCGYNTSGQLGLGDNTNKTTFTKVDIDNCKYISCGSNHTFILKNDGTVWSCGDNTYGQLGLGNTTTRNTFTKVNIDNVKSIACGHVYSVILKNDGTIWSCGDNTYGQLGLGDTTTRNTFTKVSATDVKSFICGYFNTTILKNDGTTWSCGHNGEGQLGLGDKSQRNTFTKINIDNVKNIYYGDSFTIILKNDGTVWGCGYNGKGQLGLGNNISKNTFTQVNIDNIKSIFCGYTHTIILKNDGTVWSCGGNTYGQLGLENTTDRNIFTKVNIDNVKGISFEDDDIKIIYYIIKTLQSNYTINKDLKSLSEITDIISSGIIQQKGVDIETINENISILPDDFSLVSDVDVELKLNGLQDNSQMMVASNDFITTIQDNIDYFKAESTKTGNSIIKLIFSIDSGLSWKTYADNEIIDSSIKIPCKDFGILSEEELAEWNTSKSEILLNGIDLDILATINFNTITFDKIRFAYAIHVDSTEDVAKTSKLLWQFDSKGKMQKLKDSEFDLKLHSTGVEFNPLINSDMIKVNILPNGVRVVSDFKFANNDEIDILFKQGV